MVAAGAVIATGMLDLAPESRPRSATCCPWWRSWRRSWWSPRCAPRRACSPRSAPCWCAPGGAHPHRMLLLTFLAAAVVTAVLSLDATVVLLTPVVAAAATRAAVSPRPMVYACVRLANSASLLLPVSNLTNLLALPALAPVVPRLRRADGAGVAGGARGGVRRSPQLFFARDLARRRRARTVPARRPRSRSCRCVVVGLMLVGFAALSPLGVAAGVGRGRGGGGAGRERAALPAVRGARDRGPVRAPRLRGVRAVPRRRGGGPVRHGFLGDRGARAGAGRDRALVAAGASRCSRPCWPTW